MRTNTNSLIFAALIAALTAICSWILVPLPLTPVPVNLALLPVYIAGLLLTPLYSGISIAIYILLGAIGIPVFAGFSSGIGVLAGPTGGFITGFLICAVVTSVISHAGSGTSFRISGMIAGLISCYISGILWFMYVTESTFAAGLAACVLPFIPGDIFKIAAAYLIYNRIAKGIGVTHL